MPSAIEVRKVPIHSVADASELTKLVDDGVIAADRVFAIIGYGTPEAEAVRTVTLEQMRDIAAAGHFASGSMGPKVDAAMRFVDAGGPR